MPLELPHLRRDVPITDNDYPTFTFHQQMQELIDNIQSSYNNLEDLVESVRAAQDAAEAAAREAARINSYPEPTSVLTATDAGSDASIVVANHTRHYPVMGPYIVEDVSITGDTITGLAFSTQYWVYYDDETLAETAPAFLATTTIADAQVGAESGRHFVGTITTPADGAGNTSGTGPTPPGGGGGDLP